MSAAIELVIFDCDGTLVDSEPLFNRVFVEQVQRLGIPLTYEEAWRHFTGTKLDYCIHYTETTYKVSLPDDFEPIYRARIKETFSNELKAIPHAVDVVKHLTVSHCVASNGPMLAMRDHLETTGLLEFFDPHIYSAYDLKTWKPEPDLFLHAANDLGVPPTNCLVVEDSRAGIQAGLAAGMRVLAFHPSDAKFPRVDHGEAVPISSLTEVLDHVASSPSR